MNGRRCKQLRKGFLKAFGRPCEGVPVYSRDGAFGRFVVVGWVSEWRRVKKAHLRGCLAICGPVAGVRGI